MLLEIEGLTLRFGGLISLDRVDLTVDAGELVALIGPNGAGKTCVLNCISGLYRATAGRIRFEGQDITGLPDHRVAAAGVVRTFQDPRLVPHFTVRENLLLGASSQPGRHGIAEVLDFFPKLAQRLDQQAATLSGGERKMLAIGRALLGRPRLLMLDEPTEGVWVGVIEEIATRLERLCQDMAVLLVEQHVELALRVARYAYVIDRGTVAMEGAAQELRGDERLFRFLAP